MTRRVALALAVLALAACTGTAEYQHANGTPPPVRFDCGGERLNLRFDEGIVHLDYLGEQITLPQVRAASGARYESGENLLWTRGDEAMLRRGGETVSCRQVD